MRIVLCLRGAAQLIRWLQAELPEDEILECSETEVPAMARRADVLIPTISRIGEEAMASPTLKLVQQFGAGLDTVEVEPASRHGVWVANVPSGETANAESVAELAVLLMLALARRLPQAQESIRSHRVGAPIGTTLEKKTVAIVGFGGIGRALARRLRPFEMRLLAVSRRGPRGGNEEEVDFHGDAAQLSRVLGEADFVVVATPLSDETRGLIGRDRFAEMKRGCFLVNVARGPIVDREALLDALRDGTVAGAGIDVFWQEPVDPADPLLAENVIATPHVGGATDTSLREIARGVAENVNRIRRGEPPRNCVNADAIDRERARAKFPRC